MTTTETTPTCLVKKLAEVMAAVERVPKRGTNEFHGYHYALEADIVEVVRAELAKRHVVLIPSAESIERTTVGDKGSVLTTLRMTFTFLDGESGETLTRAWYGCGTDKEDKGLYKAMTGGEKYFLLKTFLMPTGDDPEADSPKALKPRGRATSDGPQPAAPRSSAPTALAPPDDVLDTMTGEIVPASRRPPAPAGFAYVDACDVDGAWTKVTIGRKTAKTKLEHIAKCVTQGFQQGVPVRLEISDKGYINKCELWKGQPATEHGLPEPDLAPLTDDDIPF